MLELLLVPDFPQVAHAVEKGSELQPAVHTKCGKGEPI
jgi:hypothetical protein